MKRCPKCRRDYYDETLLFCLDDGNALLEGPASVDEPATAILSEFGVPSLGRTSTESATRAQIDTTAAEAEPQENRRGRSEKQSFLANRAAKPLAGAAVAVLLLAGGFFGYRYFDPSGSGAINSIAVLPFENRSGSGDTEYLSDGLADSLIYRLSQLPNLKVSPTSSVMRYKGKGGDTSQIARELNVDAVMSGRLVQIGDSLNISVQLTDARTDKLIWAEQYDRKMSDLLSTQREIATAITERLQLRLTGDDAKGITKRYTENNEAYQLYLKGRFYWNKRDEINLRKAIEQFKSAADKDANFALALVGLADSYSVLPYYSTDASSDVLPQAKTYATRALAIDDSLGEAHASLGYIHFQSWSWAEAEKELRRSIELDPNYGTGRRWFGQLLHSLGRLDEAEIEYKRAVELEPLSLIANNNLAELYHRKGDLDVTARQFQIALDLDPNWYFARMNLAFVFANRGRNAEAIVEAEKSVELSKRENISLGILGFVYAKADRRSDALKIVEELKERYQKHQAGGLDLARVYTGLGDNDQAFDWLEKEFQSRDQKMPIWFAIGIFEPLRDDARYAGLLKRMNLPE